MSPSPPITSDDTAAAKQLAIDLEESAKRLFALLKEEDRWKDTREEALRLLQQEEENGDDIGPYGAALTTSLGALQDEVQTMEERVRTLSHSHSDLTAKIDKMKKNLRRAEEQEAELLHIRPSYMDEYEMLEDELQDLHQDYVSKVRNLHYLQKELKKYDRREAKDVKRAKARRMELREKILAEEQVGAEGENEEEEGGMEPQGGGGSEDVAGIGGNASTTTPASTTALGGRPGTAATTRLSIARSDSSSSISSVAGAHSLSPNESGSDSDSSW